MTTGDDVLIRIAVPDGYVWKPGKITRVRPREFGRKRYDVLCTDGRTRAINSDPISIRAVRTPVVA